MDDEDFIFLSKHKWYTTSRGYAVRHAYVNGVRKEVSMHAVIMKPASGYEVDHINHNRLDNRRSNLRVCSHSENLRNKALQKNNTSGFTGVYLIKANPKWVAVVKLNGKRVYLGSFKTKEAAIRARLKAEEKYYGEYSFKKSTSLSGRGDLMLYQ